MLTQHPQLILIHNQKRRLRKTKSTTNTHTYTTRRRGRPGSVSHLGRQHAGLGPRHRERSTPASGPCLWPGLTVRAPVRHTGRPPSCQGRVLHHRQVAHLAACAESNPLPARSSRPTTNTIIIMMMMMVMMMMMIMLLMMMLMMMIIIIITLYLHTIKSGTYVPFTGVYIHVNR